MVHLHRKPINEWQIASIFGLGSTTMSYSMPQPPCTIVTGCNHAWTESTLSKALRTGSVSKMAARTQKALRTLVQNGSASCMAVHTRTASRTPVADWINVVATVTTDSPWNPTPSHRAASMEPHTINPSRHRGVEHYRLSHRNVAMGWNPSPPINEVTGAGCGGRSWVPQCAKCGPDRSVHVGSTWLDRMTHGMG
jgi:hypothetical protein